MAKGNFIEYVISDDPNKYPNGSEQDGYYYRKIIQGGSNSGQYVWSKQESETGPIIEYVIGDTESDYPDGGWKDGAYYILKLGKRILMGIEVTTSPTTVEYTEGDSLDLTGLVVTATFSDGSTEDVTSQCIMSPAAGTVLATTDTSVNISYTYKEVTKVTSQIIIVESAVGPYLSFLGNEDFTLKTYNTTKNWDGTLEYSTNKSTWNTWDGTEISSAGNKMYLRGTGNTKIGDYSNNYRFVFTGTDTLKIACKGNIENLLDYEKVSAGVHPGMADYCYANMFNDCTSLTSAPELPATTMNNSKGCYYYMFSGCTSLTTAPALPATELTYRCYAYMFNGCTSLTSAPELSATTLDEYCYYCMFYYCTSLTTAPELPATELANHCYEAMFSGCTSLATVPSLPATWLAEGCYSTMFYGCANIKLSTAQTGEYQTPYRIPTSDTGTIATNALSSMFTNTGGTFTGTPEINTTYYTSNTVV